MNKTEGPAFLESFVKPASRLCSKVQQHSEFSGNTATLKIPQFKNILLLSAPDTCPDFSNNQIWFLYEPDESALNHFLSDHKKKIQDTDRLFIIKTEKISDFIAQLPKFFGNIAIHCPQNAGHHFLNLQEKLKPFSSEKMVRFLSYPKINKEIKRVLVIESDYFVQQECIYTLKKMGIQVETLRADPRNYIQNLISKLATFRPDFILTINHFGIDEAGLFYHFIHQYHIPVASWFVDLPELVLKDQQIPYSENMFIFTWEKASIQTLRNYGFERVHYLPLASDTDRFHRPYQNATIVEPAFIGSSNQTIIEKWRKNGSFSHKTVKKLKIWLAQQFDHFSEISRDPLTYIHDFERAKELKKKPYAAKALILWVMTQYKRAKILNQVEQIRITGDNQWKQLVPEGHIQPPVDYHKALPNYYGSNCININITSAQMRSAVNQRVFDCPVSGGFLLTDNQSDMFELFNKDEIAIYESKEDLVEKITYFTKHEAKRKHIVISATERIINAHTYVHRMHSILNELKSGWR